MRALTVFPRPYLHDFACLSDLICASVMVTLLDAKHSLFIHNEKEHAETKDQLKQMYIKGNTTKLGQQHISTLLLFMNIIIHIIHSVSAVEITHFYVKFGNTGL